MSEHITPLLGEGLVYQQIAAGIRHEILSGDLPGGAQVMSVAAYAATHRINPATIQRGFALLVEEGLLEKRRGIGMFITPHARQQLLDARRAAYRTQVLGPALAQGRLLGFTPQELEDMLSACLSTTEREPS